MTALLLCTFACLRIINKLCSMWCIEVVCCYCCCCSSPNIFMLNGNFVGNELKKYSTESYKRNFMIFYKVTKSYELSEQYCTFFFCRSVNTTIQHKTHKHCCLCKEAHMCHPIQFHLLFTASFCFFFFYTLKCVFFLFIYYFVF